MEGAAAAAAAAAAANGAAATAAAAASFPDLHHKMSKKIAQLTKVIYLLNNKNDEQQAELSEMQRAYESDVEQVLKSACDKMESFRKQCEERQADSKLRGKLDAVVQQHAKDKAAWQATVDALRRESAARETQVKAAARERIEFMRREIDDAKAQFLARMESFARVTQALEKNHEAALAEARRAAQREVSETVVKSNAKFNSMLAERLAAEDALRKELEAARSAARRAVDEAKASAGESLRAAQEQFSRERQSWKAERTELESTLRSERMQFEARAEHSSRAAAADKAEFEAKKAELERALAEKTGHISRLQSELAARTAEREAAEQSRQRSLDQLAQNSGEMQGRVAQLEKTIASQQAQLAEISAHASSLATLRSSLQATISERDKVLETTHTKLQDALRALSARDAQVQGLEAELHAVRAKQQASTVTHERLVADSQNRAQEFEHKNRQLANELQRSSAQLASALTDLESSRRVCHELSSKVQEQQGELAACGVRLKALEAEEGALKAQISAWQQRFNESEQKARTLVDSSARELQEQAKRALAALQEQLYQEKQEASERLAQAMAAAQAAERASQAESERYAQDLAALRETHRRELEQLQRLQEDDRRAWAAAQEASERRDAEARAQLAELEQRLVETLHASTRQLEDMRQQHVQALQTLRDGSEAQASAHNAAIASMRAQYEEKLRIVSDTSSALTAQVAAAAREQELRFESERQELVRQMSLARERERAEAQSALASERQRGQEQLAEAIEKHKVALAQHAAAGQAALKDALEQQEARLEADRHAQLANAAQKHESALNAALQAWAQEKEAILKQHGETLVRLEIAHAEAMHRLRGEARAERAKGEALVREELALAENKRVGELERRLTELQRRADTDAAALRRVVAERDATIEAGQQVAKHYEAHIAEQQRRLSELERRVQEESTERAAQAEKGAQCLREAREQHEEAARALERKWAAELEASQALARERIAEARTEATHAVRVAEGRYEDLERRFEALKKKLANRESRPEDLTTIENLRAQNATLVQQRDKAIQDMRFFKLELINREENYNKVFNSKPVVGVLSAAAAAAAAGTRAAGRRGSGGTEVLSAQAQGSPSAVPRLPQVQAQHVASNTLKRKTWSTASASEGKVAEEPGSVVFHRSGSLVSATSSGSGSELRAPGATLAAITPSRSDLKVQSLSDISLNQLSVRRA